MDQVNIPKKSRVLSKILDGCMGTKEQVDIRRRLLSMEDFIGYDDELVSFSGGSDGEGFRMKGSDRDVMGIDNRVIVIYPDSHLHSQIENIQKTVLLMRDATNCRPGYVWLEIAKQEPSYNLFFDSVIFKIGNARFVSSDALRQEIVDEMCKKMGITFQSHGPATALTNSIYKLALDMAMAYPCPCWPNEAAEWATRTRLYGWPSQTLIDEITRNGCHLVPIGDKCSPDTTFQWRISFATAERRLAHSLTHTQFQVYGLLKYLLKQMGDMIEQQLGEEDVISSYFLKTVVFYAVENSPNTLWQEKHLFACFRFCLAMLIDWVKAGFCPNYFIPGNNMFLRKVHGSNQQKLLHILVDVFDMKWACLSFGNYMQPPIGKFLEDGFINNFEYMVKKTRAEVECERDMEVFKHWCESLCQSNNNRMCQPLMLLYNSQSNIDDYLAYYYTVCMMALVGTTEYSKQQRPIGNKLSYAAARKHKQLLSLHAAMSASPGLLTMATLFYNLGSYRKALEFCENMTSSFKLYVGSKSVYKGKAKYTDMYCGRGYTLFFKFKQVFASDVKLRKTFMLPQLRPEVEIDPTGLLVPPLPYSLFLSFLCYHELGDTEGREESLQHLLSVNNDEEQGGEQHWVVHTLIGICYQTLGDKPRAKQSYLDSLRVQTELNPGKERLESLSYE